MQGKLVILMIGKSMIFIGGGESLLGRQIR